MIARAQPCPRSANLVLALLTVVALPGCGSAAPGPAGAAGPAGPVGPTGPAGPAAPGACTLVDSGWGPAGQVALRVERVATGLTVPWGIAFLPGGDALLTERPGRIRLLRGGRLEPAPVATIAVGERGEGGLLGIAADPAFAENRRFYVYYTGDV